MTIIDRYIVRLAKQLNIAKEDWWDDLHQEHLGDDFLDHGEVDVWDEPELPKEIGVDRRVWSELLSRSDEDMFRYKNVFGNSGVAEYDSGVDWFLIRFKDSSMYLYTTKSTTREHIDYMRELGNKGFGLNSYVNRIVGKQYAGRNYKGVIAMQPGMESYTDPKALRALQLIIAYKNATTHLTTSVEDHRMNVTLEHFDNIEQNAGKDKLDPTAKTALAIGRRLLISTDKLSVANEGFWSSIGDFFSGRPTSVTMSGRDSGLREMIKRTISDPVWLSRQKYTLGDVKVKVLDGFTVQTAPEFLRRYRNAIDSCSQHNNRELNKVRLGFQQAEAVLSKVYSGRKPTLVEINQAITGLLPYNNYMNINIKEPELEPADFNVFTLPALTKIELKDFAKQLGEVHDLQEKYSRQIAIPDGLTSRHTWEAAYRPRAAKSSPLDGKTTLPPDIEVAAIKRMIKAYDDLRNRLNKTFRTSGKTHAAWINAENLADCYINYMSKSITNLGSSNENFTVSNEGIWGAIKYLFGGNYADLPKINAAYDEAVDAVKTTYGNPEWVKDRRLNTGKRVKVKGFSSVAKDPALMLEKVKKNNSKSFTETQQYVKEEMEYIVKFAKALKVGDESKVKALLDMFEVRPKRELTQAPEMDLGSPGDVPALDAKGILKAAEVFYEAVKYRRSTDAVYTSGLYLMMYTDSGKPRYGKEGVETQRLEGAAKELSIKIGEAVHNLETSFYNSFVSAWDNIDGVVRGTLFIMEASAD